MMPGNIVIFKVDDLMYVVLGKAEKHDHYSELVGPRGYTMLQSGFLHKLRSL